MNDTKSQTEGNKKMDQTLGRLNKGEFNTGRPYSANGQLIQWNRNNDRLYFYDTARGIKGSFEYAEKYRDLTQNEAKNMVMAHYDNGLYDNELI